MAERTGRGEADEQRYKASMRQTSRCCILAQWAEVEVGGDSVGVGRVDLDSDVLRREGFGGEFELNGGADEVAAAFIAVIIGMTVVRRGLERFVVGENGDTEIAPEIGRSRNHLGVPAAGRIGIDQHGAVGIGKTNGDEDLNDFGHVAVIELGLLRAVVGRVADGIENGLRERRVGSDGEDSRSVTGRREFVNVPGEKGGRRFVTALAEEVSFADGFFGERSGEGEDEDRLKGHEKGQKNFHKRLPQVQGVVTAKRLATV